MAADTDLKRAFEALNNKTLPYQTLFRYADGDQPTVYSTERLREAFGNINARFTQNWCSVVIDSVLDRLTLNGWDAKDQGANDLLDELWNTYHIDQDAQDAHYDLLVTGEAFIIVWPAEDGAIDIYHNDPRLVHVFYDPERPKVKQFAAKWWVGADAWHMTLYYPDRLEYYQTRNKNRPSSANAFQFVSEAENPFDTVPVFHLRGRGELGKVIPLQDAVNKLFADMMVAAEYGAFNQRWIISNADTSALKNAPNEIWEIPAGDGMGQQSSVGQFEATNLDNFLNAIDKTANAIAIISRTPKHYFFNASGQLSGEALLAMEAPLNKKVSQYQARLRAVWQELAAFLLRVAGWGDVDPATIAPTWEPGETIQPYTEAQTLQTNVSAGIPLVTALKRQGWSEDEIKAMQKDRQEQEQAEYDNTPEQ
jgi:hypothetical protein